MSKLMEVLSGAGRRVATATGMGKQAEPEKLKCTYCGGTKFYAGPEGGMSQNILCANDECRHWFNHTPLPGMELEDLHRVEPTVDEEAKRRANEENWRQEQAAGRRTEGAIAYTEGKPISSIMHEYRPYDHVYEQWADDTKTTKVFSETDANAYINARDMDRVIGYIEAMQQEIAHLRELVKQ